MAFWIHAAADRAARPRRARGAERALTYARAVATRAIDGGRGAARRSASTPATGRAGARRPDRVRGRAARLPARGRAGGAGRPAAERGRARARRLAGADGRDRREPLAAGWPPPGCLGRPGLGAGWSTVATVMHTSGTTSAPKPVALTHGNWLANALGSAVALGLDPAERWLCPMPLDARRRPLDPDPRGDLRDHRRCCTSGSRPRRCWTS